MPNPDRQSEPASAKPVTPASDGPYVTREEFEAKLIAQEHRGLNLVSNVITTRKYPKDDPRRTNATTALVFRLLFGGTAIVVNLGLISLVGLWLFFRHSVHLIDAIPLGVNRRKERRPKSMGEIAPTRGIPRLISHLLPAPHRGGEAALILPRPRPAPLGTPGGLVRFVGGASGRGRSNPDGGPAQRLGGALGGGRHGRCDMASRTG